ncbi:MAG: hypothetical protein SOX83_07555, partial [Sodaliphilus sp.]|nr:hypothetical protein [Sodaliphilus sp.]
GVSGVSFRFWTTKPPDFGPNPNKTHKPVLTHLRHLMATENAQKGNSPTGLRTRHCPASYRRRYFSAKPTFSSFPCHKPDHSLPFQMKESWAKWRFFAAMRAEYRGI